MDAEFFSSESCETRLEYCLQREKKVKVIGLKAGYYSCSIHIKISQNDTFLDGLIAMRQ